MTRPTLRTTLLALALVTPSWGALAQLGPAPSATAGGRAGTPLQQLDGVVADLDARQQLADPLLREFGALLAHQPALATQVPAILQRPGLRGRTAAVLMLGLERNGSAPAQAALTEVAGDRGQAHMDRLRAVMAAAGLDAPLDSTLDGLWTLAADRSDGHAADVSNTTYLALGALAGTIRRAEGDSPRYLALRGALLQGVHTAPRTSLRVPLLSALGNTHDPAVIDEVLPYLQAPETPVRVTAAKVLGRLGARRHEPRLAAALLGEPRGAVRDALVDALARVEPSDSTLLSLNQLVLVEPHPSVRAGMVELLAAHEERLPAVRQTLVHLRENDTSRQVWRAAVEALAPSAGD